MAAGEVPVGSQQCLELVARPLRIPGGIELGNQFKGLPRPFALRVPTALEVGRDLEHLEEPGGGVVTRAPVASRGWRIGSQIEAMKVESVGRSCRARMVAGVPLALLASFQALHLGELCRVGPQIVTDDGRTSFFHRLWRAASRRQPVRSARRLLPRKETEARLGAAHELLEERRVIRVAVLVEPKTPTEKLPIQEFDHPGNPFRMSVDDALDRREGFVESVSVEQRAHGRRLIRRSLQLFERLALSLHPLVLFPGIPVVERDVGRACLGSILAGPGRRDARTDKNRHGRKQDQERGSMKTGHGDLPRCGSRPVA